MMFYKIVTINVVFWLSAFSVIYGQTSQKELMCSFITGADLHVQLIRIFLVEKYHINQDVAEEILLYSDLTQHVLGTVYDNNYSALGPAINVLWIFFIYTIKIGKFIDSVLNQVYSLEEDKTLLTIHDSVSQLLKEFMASKFCQLDYARSDVGPYIHQVKQLEAQPRDLNLNSRLIEKNGVLYYANFIKRYPEHNSTNLWHSLVLNKVPANMSIVRSLANISVAFIDWKQFWKSLHAFFNQRNDSTLLLAAQIKFLYECQTAFIELLHTVMLHIITKHLLLLRMILEQTVDRKPLDPKYNPYNKRLLSRIKEFAVFINVDEYVYFPITRVLYEQHQSVITIKDIDSCLSNTQEVERKLTSGMIQRSLYSELKPFVEKRTLHLNDDVDDKHTLDNVLGADFFLAYIKKQLHGVQFSAVNSFMRAVESKEYKKFHNIELAEKFRKTAVSSETLNKLKYV